jgi:hypothetical protein
MYKAGVGILGLAVVGFALTMLAADVSAQEPKAKAPPACNTLKDEAACKARTDCSWVKASVDAKTGKEKRKAYCRRKPAPRKK